MDKAAAAGNNEFQSTRPVWGATMCTSRRRSSATISIHAPRVGRDAAPCGGATLMSVISIHAPRVGRDSLAPEENTDEEEISIHAPRVGRDSRAGTLMHIYTAFQSTRPVWGATIPNYWENTGRQFQSTRPVWGATPSARQANRAKWISIHAPRVGRDNPFLVAACCCRNFNPRAPCGARPAQSGAKRLPAVFQSTRPVWGATYGESIRPNDIIFQSTRPVWGATNFSGHNAAKFIIFQSTRPVWGATTELSRVTERKVFQSTRPVWGATVCPIRKCSPVLYFNPRAPCGARQQI